MKPPTISLVTPCYNQVDYVEATLRSVLNQEYPSLQYVVMDAASTDGSAEIVQRHASLLHFSKSAPDGGQYDALNQGFSRTDGEIMGWINADDMHCPWTLSVVGEIFATCPDVRWITSAFPLRWDQRGRAVSCRAVRGFSRRGFAHGEYTPGTEGFFDAPVQQESTFWRRDLWEEAGGKLDVTFSLGADFELWARFARHADLHAVATPLAGFRLHGDQKSERAKIAYQNDAVKAHHLHGEAVSSSRLRTFCRDRLPAVFQPLAKACGLLHPARRVVRTRDNSRWEVQDVLV